MSSHIFLELTNNGLRWDIKFHLIISLSKHNCTSYTLLSLNRFTVPYFLYKAFGLSALPGDIISRLIFFDATVLITETISPSVNGLLKIILPVSYTVR